MKISDEVDARKFTCVIKECATLPINHQASVGVFFPQADMNIEQQDNENEQAAQRCSTETKDKKKMLWWRFRPGMAPNSGCQLSTAIICI